MMVYLLRHGATRGNRQKRYIGSTDEPLTIKARETLAARSLPPVSRVFVSPMLRCLETAAILYPGVPSESVSGFREMAFGEFEYKSFTDLKDRPEYQAFIDSHGASAFPGGETREAFCYRVLRAFDRIIDKAEKLNGDCAIVAHGGTLMAILEARALPRRDFYDYQAECGHGYAAEWRDGALTIHSSL